MEPYEPKDILEMILGKEVWEMCQLIDEKSQDGTPENNIILEKNGQQRRHNMATKVNISCTLEQAYTLLEALELYSRIHMGQLDIIEYSLHLDTYDKTLERPKYDRELALGYLRQARQVIFTQVSDNSYIGIQHTGERSKISWDLYQQLRHDISHWNRPDEPIESRGNAFDKPFITSKQPLPTIVITEE